MLLQKNQQKTILFSQFIGHKSAIRALLPALAIKFNIPPGRWQHFLLWSLFLQRDKGKRTEITGTQHVGTLKT
jgi:hypothetical protein